MRDGHPCPEKKSLIPGLATSPHSLQLLSLLSRDPQEGLHLSLSPHGSSPTSLTLIKSNSPSLVPLFQLVILPYCPLPLNLSATSCLKPQCKGLALISPSAGPLCLCSAASLNRKGGSHTIQSSKPGFATLGM